ncbi:MAG: hypothetical protein JJT90_07600 [Ectothiorhodospiraceae bacterium]|nr:hypothetical protein [Ectothiorhodospiraceae bacterium]
MGRLILAVASAALVIVLYIVLLWGFVTWIWPILPTWAMFLVFLLIAILFMSSPITALRVYGQVRGKPGRGQRDNHDPEE